MKPTRDEIAEHLEYVSKLFKRKGIWYALTYGTLLGAMREGDIIEWDDDFDVLCQPTDLDRILSLNKLVGRHGYRFQRSRRSVDHLAMVRNNVQWFWDGTISVYYHGTKVGDLFLFQLFQDGVLRRFDFDTHIYWCPRASFPHYFIEGYAEVEIRGRTYPTVGFPVKYLEGVYGEDWQTPYRAPKQGGKPRSGYSYHGDLYEPKLHAEIEWCVNSGWRRAKYGDLPKWPRFVGGAGPIGPTPRTRGNSNSMWWRTFEELVEHF